MQKDQSLIVEDYRLDGRKDNEFRTLDIELETVKNASGSCKLKAGGTTILAWIDGPKESKGKNIENIGSVRCDFVLSQSSYYHIKSDIKRDLLMRDFSCVLKEIFEEIILLKHYPKSEIEINCVCLQNDGSFKSISITAITLALINAGIYLKDTSIGISIGLYRDTYLADLTKDEEKQKIPIINACYLPNLNKITHFEVTNNTLSFEDSTSLLKTVGKISLPIYQYIKEYLMINYTPKVQIKSSNS